MKRHRHVAAVLLLVAALPLGLDAREEATGDVPDLHLVPWPLHVERQAGALVLDETTRVVLESEAEGATKAAGFLVGLLRTATGFDVPLGPGAGTPVLLTSKGAETVLGDEGYRLEVGADGITLRATTGRGLFWGVQTLRQLLPPPIEMPEALSGVRWEVPHVVIRDAPRFAWRGLHLDVGRHWFPVDEVKRHLDVMALFKLNTFHWHLTDDQGWRIEIERYPKLTEVGSMRDESPARGDRSKGDGEPYGGFYTQEDIREVVAYASERFITVVPEIEMPGHAQAAISAYPELGNTGEQLPVRTRWGVSRHVFNVEDETFTFLENVLAEVMALFPGTFIHIGGDECPKDEWKTSPRAQARMKAEGLEDEHELQSWFIRRIERFLSAHGRRLIGWDEIQEGGLPPGAAMMVWRSVQYGVEAVKQGHDVVLSPTSHCYLDYYQGDPRYEPEAIGGLLPLERVYGFEPIPAELTEAEAKHVLGAQGNLWTEYIPTFEHLGYMAWPRGAALAEVVWSPKAARDLDAFRRRWAHVSLRLDHHGVRHRLVSPRPLADAVVFREKGEVAFEDFDGLYEIVHTRDGSVPDAASPLYAGPIEVEATGTVLAAFLSETGQVSAPARVDVVRVDDTPVPDALEPGLRLEGYRGAFRRVPDFATLEPVLVQDVDAPGLTGAEPAEHFALRYTGFLQVEKEGLVTVRLTSDDGSVFRLAGALLVDNDGLHARVTRVGRVHLRPGVYPIEIGYFELGGGQVFEVELEGAARFVRGVAEKE